ncbi:DNA (cytosine-5)-methyltransferase 1 [Dysgonomonas sp. PH5-45]|uniref:DNA cytosine methyltransferase n=1 Tax=unclassified Dysgonomonas TaxID=2630389 RepID=UPI0024765268|nr:MULTISPECIES: DNA (cytosine-5-)-methyltransferase [unclassified Dysgonomonas]MDH6354698.1 DNA (cytosine-5)-methyltransferase 1 [Dysgonomonas sp. PH5-45]MDH6387596.1 DNA (cytosine-5)-methyltransferase 1 [Dysgonomonas sp. PH5-37]
MNHASLFSGIGGFDLAAEWMGWHNVFHSEVDPFCNKILKYHFPNSISYGNIKETDFTPHKGGVDILTGGFPCQPFSSAGLRNGTDDSRYLWPEMFRAIREIRPRWVIAENVRGLLSWNGGLVLDTVCTDLENEDYEVWPFLLPACGVNAPHQRYRIWIIAYCSNNDDWGNTSEQAKRQKQQFRNRFEQGIASNTYSAGFQTQRAEQQATRTPGDIIQYEITPNTACEQSSKRENIDYPEYTTKVEPRLDCRASRSCNVEPTSDPDQLNGNISRFHPSEVSQFQTPGIWKNNWKNFPTQPPVCSRDDGLSGRMDTNALLDGRKPRNPWQPWNKWRQESVKSFGNAVVPQIPYMIFKTIADFERTLKLFE